MKFLFGLGACVAVYAFNWVVVQLGGYVRFEWIDIPMHALGGLVAGLLVIGVLDLVVKRVELNKGWARYRGLFYWAVVIAGVALIATAWELYEFFMDSVRFGNVWQQIVEERAIGVHQPSVTDTMIDYVMGLFGATVAVIITRVYESYLGD